MLMLALDKPLHRNVLAQLLSPDGYRLQFASSTAELLERSGAEAPDLALIDSDLPATGGIEACQAFHRMKRLADVPVLLLSDGSDPVRAFHAGAEDVVDWPIRPDVLLARVGTQVSLHLARQKLAHRNQEYEHLLHVLSHDLWNPIAAMRGFVRLARQTDVEGKLNEYCAGVESCLEHQENIIERVRELRAFDSGKLQSIVVPVRVADAIESSRMLMHTRFEDKHVHLETPAKETMQGISVWADPVGLTHGAICNLLSNALKFSRSGDTVRIELESDADSCTVTVRDQGVGIPRQLLPRLFQLDFATSRTGTAGERGTGFGLPLVRRVLNRAGGTITLESRDELESPDDHGTTAHMRLRRAPENGARA